MLNTPILLITFNRPDHVRRVLSEILKSNPTDIYVCQDGARDGNERDKEKCEEVREVIRELTMEYAKENKPVALHTLYQERNLGCGAGPAVGIDWFFKNVECGIVMEDDCLPHPDFFGYCEELLDRYEKDERVMFINATLYHDRWHPERSYGFSHYMVTGAWAAWRRTWDGFDLDLRDLDARRVRKKVRRLTQSRSEANWWYFKTLEIQRDRMKKSYWDYQMQILLFLKSAITIHPAINLISNIGFDAEGTHTLMNDGCGERKVFPILPLNHPNVVCVNPRFDEDCFAKSQRRDYWSEMVNYIYKRLYFSQGIGHHLLMLYKKIKS